MDLGCLGGSFYEVVKSIKLLQGGLDLSASSNELKLKTVMWSEDRN